jgi:hypothetical protein
MNSLWRDIDWRAGYQRQEEENRNAVITCECGARVLTRLDGKLVHCGDCTVREEPPRTGVNNNST